MNAPGRIAMLAAIGLLGLTILASTASAHATIYTPDNKIKVVFGHLNEPVYTYQKTGLDLTISDNATGGPIEHLESFDHGVAVPPKIFVNYRYGEEGGPELNFSENFRAQFGQPGKYTTPIMFTKAGLYYVELKGVINGTSYNLALKPQHDIEPMTDIMWPEAEPLPDEQAREIEFLRQRVDALEAANRNKAPAEGNAPGIDVVMVILIGLAALAVARRR